MSGCPGLTRASRRRRSIGYLQIALAKAGCGAAGANNASCRCQAKIKECGGCDICALLQEGQGPWAFSYDLDAPFRRFTKIEGEADRLLNHAIFDDDLCVDPRYVQELAGRQIHEALHLCGAPSFSAPRITDEPGKCQADKVEDVCMDRPWADTW